ncbi:MAG TPA: D-alanine--D-alanine ligase [Aliidongia sp.]|uniref:D-alanine--D-alanine ligase n=1 Tax=Aliidongia sp. TaxID=1914230 RepID=UPI002DDC9B27|nr:D-alanine--D-alanine ligase [Aliidongia sp.]HEV2676701.1 D-alanine--D-alanine ligase [Aliidongia sp.]
MTAAAKKKRVAVLRGGWSAERKVSLSTGRGCADALRQSGYDVVEIDPPRDPATFATLLLPRPDAVFNALHGRGGEDGHIQAMLNLLGIPYTHSGLLASAVAMDKPMAKALFAAAGLPVVEGRVASREEILAGTVMDAPYVVKPANEGSSVGVIIVREGENRSIAANEIKDTMLVERFIPGRELTVAVMGDRALGVIEIVARGTWYDYEAKYAAGGSSHICPAELPPAIYAEAERIAVAAHQALGCRGVSRADFRYDDTVETPGRLYLLEVNTQPGMTPTSLVPDAAKAAGISYAELCAWMVECAACDA